MNFCFKNIGTATRCSSHEKRYLASNRSFGGSSSTTRVLAECRSAEKAGGHPEARRARCRVARRARRLAPDPVKKVPVPVPVNRRLTGTTRSLIMALRCDACGVDCPSTYQMKQHLSGKKHRARAASQQHIGSRPHAHAAQLPSSHKKGKSSFYAVARGRSAGIYPTWKQCSAQVNGFSGAPCPRFMVRIPSYSILLF